MPKSTYPFTHTYLALVYDHVKRLSFEVALRGNELRTLAADGLKAGLQKVINVTIGHAGKVMFKDCVQQGFTSDTAAYHCSVYETQLTTDVDGKTLTPLEVHHKYCAIIGDNGIVDYMRDAGNKIGGIFLLIFAIGCMAHLLDLLFEDLGKLPEIKSVVDTCYVVVLFCKLIPTTLEPFRKETNCWAAFRAYPDTRFAYALAMLESVKMNIDTRMKFIRSAVWTSAPPCAATNAPVGKPPSERVNAEKLSGASCDVSWQDTLDLCILLFVPISRAISFIEAGYARACCVFPICVALGKDLTAWCQ